MSRKDNPDPPQTEEDRRPASGTAADPSPARPGQVNAPPTGSSQAAVEAPPGRSSRTLWLVVAGVVAVALAILLLSMGADEAGEAGVVENGEPEAAIGTQ